MEHLKHFTRLDNDGPLCEMPFTVYHTDVYKNACSIWIFNGSRSGEQHRRNTADPWEELY